MSDQTIKNSNDSILFASKASHLIEEQKVEDALNLCEAGVRQFPFYPPGHYILGLCYEALGKDEDAKNEYERTLVYDPSHNKAMRKLSDFYQKSGLEQLANELLVKEALYSPLNPEIIDILKEKNLYEQLNPENGSNAEIADDVTTEVEIESEISVDDADIESIEEIESMPEVETAMEDETVDAAERDQALTDETESISGNTALVEDSASSAEDAAQAEEADALPEEASPIEDTETSAAEAAPIEDRDTLQEEATASEDSESFAEEAAPIDDLDPLAGEELDDEDEMIIDNPQSFTVDAEKDTADDNVHDEEDFSPLMQGYLEKDDVDNEDDEDQWMEVENLLDGEEEISGADVDPVPDAPKDETEMLLEQLSSDDDDINLEAAVADPYDQIDLTSEVDKSKVAADEIESDDLAAAVIDPLEKTEVVKPPEKEESKTTEEQDGETISEIVSEFEEEEDTIIAAADEEKAIDMDEPSPEIISEDKIEDEPLSPGTESIESSEETETEISAEELEGQQEVSADEADDEVTISDMLENPNLVTPTFGEILIAQHKFSEARHVFVELSKKEPENTRFMKKIVFLDKFLRAE